MTKEERIKAAEAYAISSGADKDKKAFRTITNRDLFDHTVQCFEAGAEAEAEAESKWVECSHKQVLPEGYYNLLLRRDGLESIRLFEAKKGGSEISYFNAVAYFKIPTP